MKKIVLFLLALSLTSCLTTKNDLQTMKMTVNAENKAARTVAIEKMQKEIVDDFSKKLETINKRLDIIEQKLAQNNKKQSNKLKLSFNNIGELKETIQSLNNRIDQLDMASNNGTSSLVKKIDEMKQRLDNLASENEDLKNQLKLVKEQQKPVENVEIDKKGNIRFPNNPEKTYRQLVKITKTTQDFVLLRKAWKLYKKKFPKKRECDVLYWISETYFRNKNYGNAVLGFKKIPQNFKSCSKVEASYLRIAQSLYYLKQYSVASKVLKAMKQLFPKTSFKSKIRDLERKMKSNRKKSHSKRR